MSVILRAGFTLLFLLTLFCSAAGEEHSHYVTLIYKLEPEKSPASSILPAKLVESIQKNHLENLGIEGIPLLPEQKLAESIPNANRPLANWYGAGYQNLQSARRIKKRLLRSGITTKVILRHLPVPAAYKPDRSVKRIEPTPSFVEDQHYLDLSPDGFGCRFAWQFQGGAGERIRVADIEGDWNINHEDLDRAKKQRLSGYRVKNQDWKNHGTAIAGIIISSKNTYRHLRYCT
jgi:hypothetical protein